MATGSLSIWLDWAHFIADYKRLYLPVIIFIHSIGQSVSNACMYSVNDKSKVSIRAFCVPNKSYVIPLIIVVYVYEHIFALLCYR